MVKKLIKLNLARNCLRYIIKTYQINEIFVPYYICPTILRAIRHENCHINFYHINKNFYPTRDFPPDSYILYPNYFGICAKNVISLCQKYENIIIDNAHNFYMPDFGLASFNSLRKFFNVKDGAYLKISKNLNVKFEIDDFEYEHFSHQTYEELVSNELRLNNENIKLISTITETNLGKINLEREKLARLGKFQIFHDRFKDKNELNIQLTEYDVPFVYPYVTHDEKEAENLQKEGHLILRYWNYLPETFPEHDFYKYLIPLPLN